MYIQRQLRNKAFVSSATRFMLLFFVLLAFGIVTLVEGAIGMKEPIRYVDFLNQNQFYQQQHQHQQEKKDCHCDDVQELSISQRLNHFAPSQGQTYRQRYFYSDRFVHKTAQTAAAQQYAFLCVGGEGPAMQNNVLVDSVHCSGDMLELAKIMHNQLGLSVHLFGLEHRYYGTSYPEFRDDKNETISPVTNEHLLYLSSRQALADIGHFVDAMTMKDSNNNHIRKSSATTTTRQTKNSNPQRTIPSSCKWVTFGGSYPGMLAGWARLKYPHLIHAAVSNSAPIQAEVDYPEYNNRVAFDLQYDRIGGSRECLHVFQEGHDQIANAIQGTDDALLDKMAKQFHVCNATSLKNKKNAQLFLGDGVLVVPAQSNDPVCDHEMCNVQKMCSYVEHEQRYNITKASWEILADMANLQRQRRDKNGECQTMEWKELLDILASPEQGKEGGARSWLWQTCTEFGFYQTCEYNSDCPYAKGYHPIQQDLEICEYAFGISPREVYESVQQTLEYYGDHRELKGGSRILSVNGNVDPWSTLARIDDDDDDDSSLLPVFNAEGASHHFWTHEVKPSDGQSVVEARVFIYKTVMDWLGVGRDQGLRMDMSTEAA